MSDRPAGSEVQSGMATVLAASAATYGYTITVWSSGALLMHFRGSPKVWEIFLFAAGALAAFSALAAAGPTRARTVEPGHERIVGGALDWLAVGMAVGAVALVAQLPGWTAWPLASFLATTVYSAGAAVQLWLVDSRN